VFIVLAACIGPAVGAAIGSIWPWLLGEATVWPLLGHWYLADAVGVLVVAPLIISVALPPARRLLKVSQSWTLAVLALALVVLMQANSSTDVAMQFKFVLIPVLALIGMRMGTRSAAAAVFAVGALIETLTALHLGPFADTEAFTGTLLAQAYLATCAIASLTVAALTTGLALREDLALQDNLTGLPNRRLLLDRLDRARARRARVPGSIALVYLDLDGFKQINDTHGHAAGDQVLIATSQRLSATVRGSDTVARLGGDEFVVLLEQLADEAVLHDLMERMTLAIGQPIALPDGVPVRVGASLGHAVMRDADEEPHELLERADHAMYEVKRASRSARRDALAKPIRRRRTNRTYPKTLVDDPIGRVIAHEEPMGRVLNRRG
jgi:diguanylate cyclase (GGDEF)-like protein